jgi:hypothetical protein
MNSTIKHPFFTMQTKPIKIIELSVEDGVRKEVPKTYGRGKLRINLNSPRGNIYNIWGVALNLMKQCRHSDEEISATLAELKKGSYDECLQAFGSHKVFGSLFKLYYSPTYMFGYDVDEWGNPDEQDDECEECGDEIEREDDDDDGYVGKLCSACRENEE